MWWRLKNLWAWSEYAPVDFKQDTVNPTKGTVTAQMTKEAAEMLREEIVKGTEIIYPSKRREVLRAKESPTLDDIIET